MSTFSVCPAKLFPFLTNHSASLPPALHLRYRQWEEIVEKLAPLLHGRSPTVFISHAQHVPNFNTPEQTESKEAMQYYDDFCDHLVELLKKAGFQTHYDNDRTGVGIVDLGTTGFMQSKVEESDVIISVCTPLYHRRSTIKDTGVFVEVEGIERRIVKSGNKAFYVPVLVHASDKDFPVTDLLVGQDQAMTSVLYTDLRDPSTFLSNIWRVLFRLWKNVKMKWDHEVKALETGDSEVYENLKSHCQTSLEQYVFVLEELLRYDDYFNCITGSPEPSHLRDKLFGEFSALRLFSKVRSDIEPDLLSTLLKQEIESHSALFSISKDRNIVVLLGNTGVGKSTLINFLAGKALRADSFNNYELVNESDREAMKIGHGFESETAYPGFLEVGPLVLFDLPGFADSSGSIRDLINSAFIYQILMSAQSVRFVFVLGYAEMDVERGKAMKKLFHSVVDAFPNHRHIMNDGSMLMITKSDYSFAEMDKLYGFIEKKLTSRESNTSAFLKERFSVWQRNQAIHHLPKPSVDDISNNAVVRQTLLRSIESIQAVSHTDMKSFNLSRFYSAEVTIPLLKMFLYVIRRESFDDCQAQIRQRIESLVLPAFPADFAHLKLEDIIKKIWNFDQQLSSFSYQTNEIQGDIHKLTDDAYWQTNLWPELDERMLQHQEVRLLKDIFKDTYDEAKRCFQTEIIAEIQLTPALLEAKVRPLSTETVKFERGKRYMFSLVLEKHSDDHYSILKKKIQSIVIPSWGPDIFDLDYSVSWELIDRIEQDLSRVQAEETNLERQITEFQSDESWIVIWEKFDRLLDTMAELKLLKDTFTDSYEKSKELYQDNQKSKIADLRSELQRTMSTIPNVVADFAQGKLTILSKKIEEFVPDSYHQKMRTAKDWQVPRVPDSFEQGVSNVTDLLKVDEALRGFSQNSSRLFQELTDAIKSGVWTTIEAKFTNSKRLLKFQQSNLNLYNEAKSSWQTEQRDILTEIEKTVRKLEADVLPNEQNKLIECKKRVFVKKIEEVCLDQITQMISQVESLVIPEFPSSFELSEASAIQERTDQAFAEFTEKSNRLVTELEVYVRQTRVVHVEESFQNEPEPFQQLLQIDRRIFEDVKASFIEAKLKKITELREVLQTKAEEFNVRKQQFEAAKRKQQSTPSSSTRTASPLIRSRDPPVMTWQFWDFDYNLNAYEEDALRGVSCLQPYCEYCVQPGTIDHLCCMIPSITTILQREELSRVCCLSVMLFYPLGIALCPLMYCHVCCVRPARY